METIYKYPLAIVDRQQIDLPMGGVILHVGLDPQHNPCVWARVPQPDLSVTSKQPTKTMQTVTLFVVGTGNPIPSIAKRHLGSFTRDVYVWHVFTTES